MDQTTFLYSAGLGGLLALSGVWLGAFISRKAR